MANFKGTNKADTLRGTAGNDRIQGLGGNDRLFGEGGNDTLDGGGGDDLLQGGAGSDTIDGGTGTDTIDYSDRTGGIRVNLAAYRTDTRGNGTVEEYDTNGVLVSTDTVTNIENITGGSGNDYIRGNYAFNVLRGGDGRDLIIGGDGSDALYGDGGDDLLSVGGGNTFIDGGAGVDTVFWELASYYDTIVDLEAGQITYRTNSYVETLVSIENVRAGWGDDWIIGSAADNAVQAGPGDDVVTGGAGDDLLIGNDGRPSGASGDSDNDRLDGGVGDDVLVGDEGNDFLTGGSGSDQFQFDIGSGHDMVTDFESGVDSIALFGGLTIAGWELRDSDGDGSADSQTAILSDGSTIMFLGHASVPDLNLTMSSEALNHIELSWF